MPYNKDLPDEKRRGPYHKQRAYSKGVPPPSKALPAIEHNALYPYLLAFLEARLVKGLSPGTVHSDDRALRRFILWCDDRGLDDPRAITKPILERYQRYLFYYRKTNGEPLSFGSQSRILGAIKALFKWLSRENHIASNPASELELPKRPHRLPKAILSLEEVQRVLHLADGQTVYSLRDRAILETFYSTGIRRMELANLHVYDLDPSRQTVLIREGKGRKDRLLPIGDSALYWVQLYQQEARPFLITNPQEQTLFLTDYGEPWLKNRLSDMVKKYFHHAKIDKVGACHLFRHAMATHMLDNGADIRYIQQMLGHSDLSTTQIYTQVAIEKLRAIHKATHPATLDPLTQD